MATIKNNTGKDSSDTKETILNTAEKLFAEKGYYNTSTRELTTIAKVNLSAINYHFGSKEKLFEAVITRRLIPINEKRMEMLNKITALSEKEKPDTRAVFNAFFEPVWELMVEDENAKYFLMIIGTIMQDADTRLRKKFISIMKPVGLDFFEQICKALPELEKNEIFMRVQLSMGAFFHSIRMMFSSNDKDDLNHNFHFILPDKDDYYRQIIDYITKGMAD